MKWLQIYWLLSFYWSWVPKPILMLLIKVTLSHGNMPHLHTSKMWGEMCGMSAEEVGKCVGGGKERYGVGGEVIGVWGESIWGVEGGEGRFGERKGGCGGRCKKVCLGAPTHFPTSPPTFSYISLYLPPHPNTFPHTYLHTSPHLLTVWQSYHVTKFLASLWLSILLSDKTFKLKRLQ